MWAWVRTFACWREVEPASVVVGAVGMWGGLYPIRSSQVPRHLIGIAITIPMVG